MNDSVMAVAGTPGELNIAGRVFVILPPTPRDMLAGEERMTALAREKCLTPLEYVLKLHGHLPQAALALAVREAIAIGSGSEHSREPTPELIWKQYATLEGIRWRAWYHISRAQPVVSLEEVAELVTDDNRFDVAAALDRALKFGELDPKDEPPATGS